jgi:tetratricopeptide (TPR) repeat protein
MAQVAFLEFESPSASKVFEAFQLAAQKRGWAITWAASLEELVAIAKDEQLFIILNWNGCNQPHFVVEAVCQHPRLSAASIVVTYKWTDQADLDLLKEYGIDRLVAVGVNLDREADHVLMTLRNEARALKSEEIAPLHVWTRRFFEHLHNGRFGEAEAILAGTIAPATAKAETVYLRGILLKYQKEFADSMKFLSSGLSLTRNGKNLEPKFLHLIGNVSFKRKDYENAIKFLEAAHRLSPRHPRREFLLAQAYFETNAFDDAWRHYQALYVLRPSYPGIHARMVELLVQRPDADFEQIPALLAHVSEQRLAGLAKRAKKLVVAQNREKLAIKLGLEYMRHAQVATARDDLFGALAHYVQAGKLLAKDDAVHRRALLEQYGELCVRLEDWERIAKCLPALEALGSDGEAYQRIKAAYGAARKDLAS